MNIRMSAKGKRPLRSLTPSDKIHAIQRIHDGESKASVARDIGVPESTLRGWCKNEDKLRFMSRQSQADKMSADSLSDKLCDSAGLLGGGPPEKRQKLDSSLPLNFSNKMKYDEMAYKRSPLNGLDFSTSKALNDLSFNSLGPDYGAFKGADLSGGKNKGYGADLSRQQDPSLAAISPLSSLSHLSGLTGLSHSPLAISFSELTSNLNLIAQLNPSLAAMSGLNGLHPGANSLRNMKPKAHAPSHSPRSDSDKPQGLSVKNWAKQKNSSDSGYGLNLTADNKTKMKSPSPSLAPSLGAVPGLDDPLLYWLKSQQAMLGLNSMYPPNPSSASPPIRASTPQMTHHTSTPPISSTPLTPSSTPSGCSDDMKNSAWFNWCKAFGASLNSLNPHGMLPGATNPNENILYSHLTKEAGDNLNNNEICNNSGKAEDLSAKPMKTPSPRESPEPKDERECDREVAEIGDLESSNKDVLDNLLYKINNTHSGSESDASYNSDSLNNNNNNNNSKTDEEEKGRYSDADAEAEDYDGLGEALEHGEKFLKWLENCSNPRVTAVQLMQLRFLITSIKSGTEKVKMSDDEQRTKIRRRK